MTAEPIELVGLSRPQLTEALVGAGLSPHLVRPLWNRIYVQGVTDLSTWDGLSPDHRRILCETFRVGRLHVISDLTSTDATRKWLLELRDTQRIETVVIPEQTGGALCISSQVGCSLTCSFCRTGTMNSVRNLTPAEIVGQVLIARDRLREWGQRRVDCRFANVVLMGMGEPLFNYDNVAAAVRILIDGEGLSISRRRIMLSTAGVVPLIERVGRELGVNLAISLHAVRNELRDQLVPLNRKYPLEELLDACRRYPAASNARRITFEYVMLDGVNDSDTDARVLARLLKGIHAKVNLIPWNPWPGAPYQTSTPTRVRSFAEIVNSAGYSSAIRATRGDDIMAACGQLNAMTRPRVGGMRD